MKGGGQTKNSARNNAKIETSARILNMIKPGTYKFNQTKINYKNLTGYD